MKFRESFAELTERLPLVSWVTTPNDSTISRFSTISTPFSMFFLVKFFFTNKLKAPSPSGFRKERR